MTTQRPAMIATFFLMASLQAAIGRAETILFRLSGSGWDQRNAYVSDPAGNPYPALIGCTDQLLQIDVNQIDRIALHLMIEAGPAGRVMVTADNRGLGYEARQAPYDLLDALLYSITGHHRTNESPDAVLEAIGIALVARENRTIAEAKRKISEKRSQTHSVVLRDEGSPVAHTRVTIEQLMPDPPIGFGQDRNYHASTYREHFAPLIDFTVVPFYLKTIAPDKDEYRFDLLDPCVEWCHVNGVSMQGSPLIWFYEEITPDWLYELEGAALDQWIHNHVTTCVKRYAGKIDSWVVVNEAHGWANCLDLSRERLIEVTQIAARAAREADPDCEIVLNCCLPWGDYVQWNEKSRGFTPFEWFQQLIRRGCPFDSVGLQLYNGYAMPFPHRDLTAMNALLERFAGLGKPIQVSEFAAPSGGGVHGAWRGQSWTLDSQAAYSRAFFEIAFSKPYVETITWWFQQDVPGTEWLHLGLLTAGLEPKPVLHELVDLKRSWMTNTQARTDQQGRLEFQGGPGRYRLNWQDESGVRQERIVHLGENPTPLLQTQY